MFYDALKTSFIVDLNLKYKSKNKRENAPRQNEPVARAIQTSKSLDGEDRGEGYRNEYAY